MRQFKAFPVPLIDVAGEAALAQAMPLFRWMDRIVTGLNTPMRMRADFVAQVAGEHLRAETNPDEWGGFLKRNGKPVNFPAQPSLFIIHTHRTAENDRPGVTFKR